MDSLGEGQREETAVINPGEEEEGLYLLGFGDESSRIWTPPRDEEQCAGWGQSRPLG